MTSLGGGPWGCGRLVLHAGASVRQLPLPAAKPPARPEAAFTRQLNRTLRFRTPRLGLAVHLRWCVCVCVCVCPLTCERVHEHVIVRWCASVYECEGVCECVHLSTST